MSTDLNNTFVIGLSHEVWFEHILPFFSSNQLLNIRLVNRDLSAIIFSFIVKFKTEFKIQVGFPNAQLKKIVDVFLIRLEQLKTITYEDYDSFEDFCLNDEGITALHPLKSIESVNLKSLSTLDGSFIKNWIDLKSPLVHSIRHLSLNKIDDEYFELFDNFTNLSSLSVEPTDMCEIETRTSSVILKLPPSLEKLTLGYEIETHHLNQIAQQCPNLTSLIVGTSEEMRENRMEELPALKKLNTLKLISYADAEYDGYVANMFPSLVDLENLTNLQVSWAISEQGSIAFDNLKLLGTLKNIKTLRLCIGCPEFFNDVSIYENALTVIVETICKMYSLEDLSIRLWNDEEIVLGTEDLFKNIPQLNNLKKFSLGGQTNCFFTPLLKHFFGSSLSSLEVFTDQELILEKIYSTTDQRFTSLEHVCIECKCVNNGFLSKILNQFDLERIKSLNIRSVEFDDLEIISQMNSLETLVLTLNEISSFQNIKLPKLLKTLKFEKCTHLTGEEENFFQNCIAACPLLELLKFNMCAQLKDSLVESISKCIADGADLKRLYFVGCDHLTNSSIYCFKDITTCNVVMFQQCREMQFTQDLSKLLKEREFIQLFGGENTHDDNWYDDGVKCQIVDPDIIHSLQAFQSIIQQLIDSKQFYKGFLYLKHNPFNRLCPLFDLLEEADLETKWYFNFALFQCSGPCTLLEENIVLMNIVLSTIENLLTTTTDDDGEGMVSNVEEKKKAFLELAKDGDSLCSRTSNNIIPLLIRMKCFESAIGLIMYTDDDIFETIKSEITVEDCFEFEYMNELLNSNDSLVEQVVNSSPFFQNCPEFIQELQDRNISIVDHQQLSPPQPSTYQERVPPKFKNSHLTEVIIPMHDSEYGRQGECEAFEAFGFKWSLELVEEEWLKMYFRPVSLIPTSCPRSDSLKTQYELLGGNDGDSVEISFMLLNFDNNPCHYFSGRAVLDQANKDYYHSIRNGLVQKFTENSYKFLIGLQVINHKEKIPCPFLSPKYSIHKISLSLPKDLSGNLYNNIKTYSDPITAFGIKWNVKLEKNLTSGNIGLYLRLASFDLFDSKSAIHQCKVEFYFANKNIHPDSTTDTMRKTFKDTNSCIGTEHFAHPELFKPEEEIVDGETFERYDISLILELKFVW